MLGMGEVWWIVFDCAVNLVGNVVNDVVFVGFMKGRFIWVL